LENNTLKKSHMANLPETPQWEDGIYQLEVVDLVIGGLEGVSNRQAEQLGNRTAYLKQAVETAQSDADAAQTTAGTAAANAAAAQAAANAAQTAADAAQGTADTALSNAATAQAAADAAQSDADAAQATADAKVSKAGDTMTGALEVQGGIRFQDSGEYVKTKRVSFSGWDMVSNATKVVPHGLPNMTKMREVRAYILSNGGNFLPLNSMNSGDVVSGGVTQMDNTNVTLRRSATGQFNSALYNAASGYVAVDYVD
jgi:hypothetical protein